MSQYTKSYSSFIQKSFPTPTDNGNIFETDVFTFGDKYDTVNGNLVVRSEGGFTFVTNTTPSDEKTPNNGQFDGVVYDLRTILNLEKTNTGSTSTPTILNTNTGNTYIDLKLTYSDLTKYAYFGSLNLMLEGGVNDIINRFPAALYVENTPTSISEYVTGYTFTTGSTFITGVTATNDHPRWDDDYNQYIGNDKYNFNGLPSGHYDLVASGFTGIGVLSHHLINEEMNSGRCYVFTIYFNTDSYLINNLNKQYLCSVRIVRDVTSLESGLTDGTIIMNAYTDIDGNNYTGSKIQGQVWVRENLKVTKYLNGDSIPTNRTTSQILNATNGGYEVYPLSGITNNSNLTTQQEVVDAYGLLYNWYAIQDVRGFIDTTNGWRIPSAIDFQTLSGTTTSSADLRSTRQVNSPYVTGQTIITVTTGVTGQTVTEYIYPNTLTGSSIQIPITGMTNPFNIDISDYTINRVNFDYNLRTMATSYYDYQVVLSDDTIIGNVTGFTGISNPNNTNNILLNLDVKNNNINSSFFIVPKKQKQEEFFESLDDLQNNLLNRYGVPKYKSNFKIPYETENGIQFKYLPFIWKTYDGYNLDITSVDYVRFIEELIEASAYIDENFSDNIYRSLTHDSIKNMDNTYEMVIDQEKLDEYVYGTTQIQSVLRLYGREYDEIKKYIEGISFVNTITYNKENNLPEKYLSDKLNTCGWEANSLLNFIDKTIKTKNNLYPSIDREYDVFSVNDEIYRRLIINSNEIWKSKGTRKSIVKLFNIFGLDSDSYEIREYVQPIDNYISGATLSNISNLNGDIITIDPTPYSPYSLTPNENLFYGLNIGQFVKCPSCGREEYTVDASNENIGICTYDGVTFDLTGNTIGYPRPQKNSGNFYFQQMGGWYQETGGLHTNYTGGTYVNEMSTGNNPHIGNGSYDFGYDYIDQFQNVFKHQIKQQPTYPTFNISDYSDLGFNISQNMVVDNFKVVVKNKENISENNNTLTDNRLLLNLKNLVVGVNGEKLLSDFYKSNTNYDEVILIDSGSTIYVIGGRILLEDSSGYELMENGDYAIWENSVTGKTGGTYTITDSTPNTLRIFNSFQYSAIMTSNLSSDKVVNIYFEQNSVPFTNIYSPSEVFNSGETWTFSYTYNTNTWVISQNLGYEFYSEIKNITMPYLEQIIPSTTVFDLVLIDKKTPKWVLIDKYCERYDDLNQNYNGNTVLKYKNFNYFDEYSTGYSDLDSVVLKDFGSEFNFFNEDSQIGFGRVVVYKGNNGDCDVDSSNIWEKCSDCINPSSWTTQDLIDSGMSVDEFGGMCLKKKFDYYTYNKTIVGCDCTGNTQHVITYDFNGVFIQPYVNTNINYSINLNDDSIALVLPEGTTITNWLEEYVEDLITTGYTGYNGSDYEERVIYSLSDEAYFKVDHENLNVCSGSTTQMLAIYNYYEDTKWDGTGDYWYYEKDSCGNNIGSPIVHLVDINPNSITYNATQDIIKC